MKDEMVERAAKALYYTAWTKPTWEASGNTEKEKWRAQARIALTAANVDGLLALIGDATEVLMSTRSNIRDPGLAMSWGRKRKKFMDAAWELTDK